MEARCLSGPDDLFEQMQLAVSPSSIWPSPEFFAAKRKEQLGRHHRYDDTAYKLEPNVKGSPGGPAGHPDDRLGCQAPFWCGHAG